jgi:alpha-beta hydrolase superfamily lysophospholipase
MFKYFEKNYAWNTALATLIEEVGTLAEPMEAFQSVAHLAGADPEVANLAWRDAMAKLAERLERLADQDLAEGHRLTASRKYHRAAMYFIRVERMASHRDSRRFETYRRALANFRNARELGNDGVEFVDIPYQNGAIPALLVKAGGDKPTPIVIHLQGFDSVKETQWPAVQEYRRRGMSVLILDQPGAGGALRLHGLTAVVESETYVSRVVNYILGRPDIATQQIGLAGLSMGGFLAPRAAAFEPRIKAVASWGAFYKIRPPKPSPESASSNESPRASLPSMIEHAMWAWGCASPEAFRAVAQTVTLEGVVRKIQCPFLIIHGEGDQQIPLSDAIAVFEEATTPNKKLKVFRKDEGGYEHCQLDNVAFGADYLTDWFAEIFAAA